ncbi:MAG TPA: signal peptidase I [Gammaproteobacteria bacterium]|nr:signal peptidase I [Gammaproteobacteria bacterium]
MLNFSLILVLATFFTGLVWLVDSLLLARRRPPQQGRGELKEPLLVEYSKAFFPILLIVLVLRSFVAEPFKIPSGSMLPTLHIGDFILVNKFSYGLRLPVLNTKILQLGEPERGDVVVFKYPEDPRLDFIKRVIGLPGDRISYRGKQIYINGQPVAVEPLTSAVPLPSRTGFGYLQELVEHLPEVEHHILLDSNRSSADVEYQVPEGHYFVMGDNRDDSRDSRVWGYMPEKNLVGKAFFIWMHWDIGGDGLDFSRIGERIH